MSKQTKTTATTTPSARIKSRPPRASRKPREIRKSPIRKRHDNEGSERRIRKVTIRLTERLSNELASIQGLIYAFGKQEPRADIFEQRLMPVLRHYVNPYAIEAKKAREAERAARRAFVRRQIIRNSK